MTPTDSTFGAGGGSTVTVRMAAEGDAGTLARLAALDSASMPVGPALLAEVDGEAVAALPLTGGAPVADPFHSTSAAIELLELRAAQIRGRPATSTRRLYGKRLRAMTMSAGTVPLR